MCLIVCDHWPDPQRETLTTVVHAVEPDDVHSAEVQPLTYHFIEFWYGGSDGGDALILVEGQWPVVHDGFIVVWRVHISDEVIFILIEVVLFSCEKNSHEMTFVMC